MNPHDPLDRPRQSHPLHISRGPRASTERQRARTEGVHRLGGPAVRRLLSSIGAEISPAHLLAQNLYRPEEPNSPFPLGGISLVTPAQSAKYISEYRLSQSEAEKRLQAMIERWPHGGPELTLRLGTAAIWGVPREAAGLRRVGFRLVGDEAQAAIIDEIEAARSFLAIGGNTPHRVGLALYVTHDQRDAESRLNELTVAGQSGTLITLTDPRVIPASSHPRL